MTVQLAITDTQQLHALGKALKDAGAKDLQTDLAKRVRAATKPMRADAKRHVVESLPEKGGLNKWVHPSMTVKTVSVGRNVGVRITATKKRHDLASINRGRLRHPVFARPGRKRVWANQQVTPGAVTAAFEKAAPQVRAEVRGIIADLARRVPRG